MEEKKELISKKKEKEMPEPRDFTTCEATAQMLEKPRGTALKPPLTAPPT